MGPMGLDLCFAKSVCVRFYDRLDLQPGPLFGGSCCQLNWQRNLPRSNVQETEGGSRCQRLHLYAVRAVRFGPMSHQQGLPSHGTCCGSGYWCTPGHRSFSKAPVLLGVLWSVVSCQQPSYALGIFFLYSYWITEHCFY